MHLAVFVSSLARGGTERVVANLVEYMSGRGHQVTVVTPYQREAEYTLPAAAKRVISDISADEAAGKRLGNFWRRFRKLRNVWLSEKPDVILSFIGKNNMMAIITSRRLGIPVAVAVRAPFPVEYPTRLEACLAKFLFRYANGVILQTAASQSFFPPAVRRRVQVLRNPVAPQFMRPRYEGAREKTVVAVGRTVGFKNHRMLIQAFAKVAGQFPEHRLLIYGEGELRERLKAEAASLGVAERVDLPGNSDCLWEDIYRASVYVLCSNYEGSPNSLIEAMLLGLPCIATDCPGGGVAELVEDGVNGLLIPMRDLAKLTESLRYLLENPAVAEALGREAHRLQSLYAPEVVYGEWERYLMEVR
ncbi:MAG: glycosyltransferase [Lachnospiraceae bacterium]|jgi:glycosyltransferase involved in cell wall biosynthesis|nr:glycosyltransferase [Lachnospiraceae bacterium]